MHAVQLYFYFIVSPAAVKLMLFIPQQKMYNLHL